MKRSIVLFAILFLFTSAAFMGGSGVSGCGGGGQVGNDNPTVDFTVPVDGDTDVFLNWKITATFSEAMDPATISTLTFTLSKEGGLEAVPVAGEVAYVDLAAVFAPTENLSPDTVYTATITTGAKNLEGTALAANKVWSFTTGTEIDTSVPTVTTTIPRSGATDVFLNQKITATFSKAMDPTTITTASFTLKQGDTTVSGSVAYSGLAAVFTPASNLQEDTEYTATITTDVEGLAGSALASEYTWSFTTGDSVDVGAPIVTLLDPLDEATDVPLNQTIVATFSENMNPLTINGSTFTLYRGTTRVLGELVVYSVVGRTATFTPENDLLPNTLYTATITTGASDLTGNELAADEVWSFTTGATTDTTPPTVTLTSPLDGAENICNTTTIDATFSELMNPLTITTDNFTVSDAPGTLVFFPETKKVIFTPNAPLVLDTLYTATITTDVKDVAGNAMAADEVWTFRTSDVECQAPVILFASGDILQPYGVLSGLAITLAGVGTGLRVDGDVGIHPGSTCNGCDTTTVSGTINIANAPAAAAKEALVAAYDDAMGRTVDQCTLVAGGDLSINPPPDCGGIGNGTFTPGLYWSGTSVDIPVDGTITLDAEGDADAVFIFQSDSTIVSNNNSHVTLANGAQAKNIFWVAGSSATIGGTTSDFAGTVIALEDFTILTGTEMEGRALARNGNLTVQDGALITVPTP